MGLFVEVFDVFSCALETRVVAEKKKASQISFLKNNQIRQKIFRTNFGSHDIPRQNRKYQGIKSLLNLQ